MGFNGKDYSHRLGEIHITNEGYEVEIIAYKNASDVDIKFLYNKHIVCSVNYSNIKRKTISNPYHASVYNIGYIGVGKYTSKSEGKVNREYTIWCGMLERCYSEKYHIKKPTYMGCIVDEYWHNFQNFAEWYKQNYNLETMKGWHLDKDILIKGNKIYSPKTCCFVPQEINALLKNGKSLYKERKRFKVVFSKNGIPFYFGLYKTKLEAMAVVKIEKEVYIKEVADEWKDQIDPKVYKALINYQVEITD